MIRAARTFDDDLIGYDVIPCTAVDGPESEDCRIERINLAADDVLYCRQELSGRYDSIGTTMRHGSMTGFSADRNGHVIRSRHHGTGQNPDLTRRKTGPDVKAIYGIGPFEDSRSDDGFSPAIGRFFFCRLADKKDRSGKSIFQCRQDTGRAEENRCVCIMAAGMHDAGRF